MKEETRALIRHLYFVDHLAIDVIAEELRLTRRAVRRALVVRGGVRRRPSLTPNPKENDS
jgi:hypothetical protein